MEKTPEAKIIHAQDHDRQDLNSLEAAAKGYARQAREVFLGKDGVAAHDEVARFSQKIASSTGPEQYDVLQSLVRALNLRKPSILSEVPDDEYDRAAFALALVQTHETSLH